MARRAAPKQAHLSFTDELEAIASRVLDGRNLEPAHTVLVESIRAGGDPLGDAYIAARPADERRQTGTVYTPVQIVSSMIAWAKKIGNPERVVDPGSGSGRFLLAAAQAFPEAKLIGIEPDPVAAKILRANIAVNGLGNRATVFEKDYRAVDIPSISGQTLFIGNPPYVRHHDIDPEWKKWFAYSASAYGQLASKLSGLHIHFFVRTLQLAKEGDIGAFITSAEWLDVNYGSVLRNLLGAELGGTSLHVIDPTAMPFPDAITTGAITCFRVGAKPKSLKVQSVDTLADLNALSRGQLVSWDVARRNPRWSTIVKPQARPEGDLIELGEICRVHRGQVTGNNDVWVAGSHAGSLPKSVLFPTITRAKELIQAVDILDDEARLRRVIDIPAELDQLEPDERKEVEKFLRWAKRQGADQSYTAQHRRAWWEVRLKDPAPIVCTYMARRPPAFVRNLCEARHIKGGIKFQFRDMPAETLFPYALLYCEIVDYLGMGPAYKIVPGDLDADDQDEVEIMFEEAWDQVEFGTGENLLSVAHNASRAMTAKDFPGVTNPHKLTLLGICSYLQKSQGAGKPFLLPQDRLAEMLGCSQQFVSATIHSLMRQGYLKQVEGAVHLKAKAAKYKLHKPRKKR